MKRTSTPFALLTLLLLIAIPAGADTHYLQPDGSGDFPSIQDAVDAASSGDDIILAGGTYAGEGNRDVLIDGKTLALYGDWSDLPVLDCDGDSMDPHRGFLVQGGGDLTLQNLDIVNGWAQDGGGILVTDTSRLEIRHCSIEHCRAANRGGGLHAEGTANLLLAQIDFEHNAAQDGGGLYIQPGVVVSAQFTQITLNSATHRGGGAYVGGSAHIFTEGGINSNSAGFNGGGIFVHEGRSAQFTGMTIFSNDAEHGGGAYADSFSTPSFQDCSITYNTARTWGGGLAAQESDPVVTGGVFEGNDALRGGSVWAGEDHVPHFQNIHFRLSDAEERGGVIYATGDNMAEFEGCIFTLNDIASGGNGVLVAVDGAALDFTACTAVTNIGEGAAMIYCENGGTVSLSRCLLAWNRGKVYEDYYSPGSTLDDCNLYANRGGNWTDDIAGQLGVNGNIGADPLLCDPCEIPANVNLVSDSPCAAANSACGQEIGAGTEDPTWPNPWYGVIWDTSNWVGMFPDLNTALAEAPADAEIVLSDAFYMIPGFYDLELDGFHGIIRSRGGDPEACGFDLRSDSGYQRRLFALESAESSAAVFRDLGIRNASQPDEGGAVRLNTSGSVPSFIGCDFTGNHGEERGGAIWLGASGAPLSLYGCRLEANHGGMGGAIYMEPGTELGVESCTFVDNGGTVASGYSMVGAAIYMIEAQLNVFESHFESNIVNSFGGAVYLRDPSTTRFEECTFRDNRSGEVQGGGAVELMGSGSGTVTFLDCLFENNHGPEGGAAHCRNGNAIFRYCRFVDNHSEEGGAVRLHGSGTTLEYCTFLENSAHKGGAVYANNSEDRNRLRYCTLVANRGFTNIETNRGQIFDDSDYGLRISNCIVSHGVGTRAYAWSHTPVGEVFPPIIENSNFFANEEGDWIGDIEEMLDSYDNLTAEPMFCDFENSVFTVADASPCHWENSQCMDQIGAWGVGCSYDPVDSPAETPRPFALAQNHPNPFNPVTEIRFDLLRAGAVKLAIYDAAGRLVDTLVEAWMDEGRHAVTWRGLDAGGNRAASGVYFYRLDAKEWGETRKMVLLQ
jgi:hypothetical protein